MASAEDVKKTASDLPARQHLDELEELMQRMLALPVDPPGDSEIGGAQEPASTDFRFDDRQPRIETEFQFDDSRPEQRAEDQSSPVQASEDPPSALPPDRSKEEPPEESTAPPARQVKASFSSDPTAGKASQAAGIVVGRSIASLRAPPVPLLRRPVLLINRAFDRCTRWLGPPGRWARSQQGRGLLGWVGVILLVVAVTWVLLDGMGWFW